MPSNSNPYRFGEKEVPAKEPNPNPHDVPTHLPFRVELWGRNDQYVRWESAASASVAVGHAALDAAIASYPGQRFTLRNGIQVIREHVP